MPQSRIIFGILLLNIMLIGCAVNFSIPESLLAVGTPFVVKGTATLADDNGPCLIWIGQNNITYHLFQGPTVDNEIFDQIITPGVTSRLILTKRTDLEVACQMGTIVEVQDVLEIVE